MLAPPPRRVGRSRLRLGAALALVLAVAGCPTFLVPDDGGSSTDAGEVPADAGGDDAGVFDGGICDDRAVPGIVVTALDGSTKICTGSATADDGSSTETLLVNQQQCQWFGAIDAPGTYTVTVAAAGYAVDTRENVVVELNACQRAVQKSLTFLLQRPDAGTAPVDAGGGPF